MKLAFCLFNYFPYGGLQRDFLRIAKACYAQGHEIHVFTMEWQGESVPGFHLHFIKPKGWQNHTRSKHFAAAVKKHLEAEKFDVVVGFNKMPNLDWYYAADVCYKARIQTQRSILARLSPRYRQWLAMEKAVFAQGAPTQILLISSLQQSAFMECYQTEPERFHLLPPGIAKDRIAPANAKDIRAAIRSKYHLTDKDYLLLMVGSAFKTKGVDRSLQAIAALPESLRECCRLFVIGQDNPKDFLALAQQLKIQSKVKFLGGRSDVPDFLLAADLLLHPAYHENTGTVLLEAMTAGLPVLTTAVCGYAHYIKEAQAGEVIPLPYTQDNFNQSLKTMLLSPDKQIWRQNALQFTQQADIYSLPERAAALITKPIASTRSFQDFMALKGEIFRQQKGRTTQQITVDDKTYFIKQHHGVGWREIFKNLSMGRLPIISAKNEWQALMKLKTLGVPVPEIIAYGEKGKNPARLQSYVVMQALTPVVSLEDLAKTWENQAPSFQLKQQLIAEVARIARILHQNGINHRDFYICHFLLDLTREQSMLPKLYLIDLHRAQLRKVTPQRWIIKDLASLMFSCKNIQLTARDFYRFMKIYRGMSLRDLVKSENNFWQRVNKRGNSYRDHTL